MPYGDGSEKQLDDVIPLPPPPRLVCAREFCNYLKLE